MNIDVVKSRISSGELDDIFFQMTQSGSPALARGRWLSLIDEFTRNFSHDDIFGFSAPGRTEVSGNHTDHQWGRVMAAAVNLDTIAIVAKNHSDVINIRSKGYTIDPVNIRDLQIRNHEKQTTEALIRGICAHFVQCGHTIGGFDAVVDSQVLPGSGISSSAAFEVLIGQILSGLFNQGKIDAQTIAIIGQQAENIYFQKPCGLMDQMTSAVGGFVYIDFYQPDQPIVEKFTFDLNAKGYTLCLINTGGSHENLSDAYGLMPNEMKQVAKFFDQPVLSRVTYDQLIGSLPQVRKACGDRACLRAIHFLKETQRVSHLKEALVVDDMSEFMRLIVESGRSSYMYLQNVYLPTDSAFQPLAIALAVSEQLLSKGAYRVHGGGLAGTIQAFVPNDQLDDYVVEMENIFGKDSVYTCSIRPVGSMQIF